MIEAVATVREVEGDQVVVEVRRRTACGACESSASCGTSVLSDWFSRRVSRVRVRSALPLRAGEAVVIGLEESALLRASILLYLVPVVALVAGAVAGTVLAEPAGAGDWPAIAGGVLGLASGLGLSRARATTLLSRGRDEVVLLRRDGTTVNLSTDPGSAGNATQGVRDD